VRKAVETEFLLLDNGYSRLLIFVYFTVSQGVASFAEKANRLRTGILSWFLAGLLAC